MTTTHRNGRYAVKLAACLITVAVTFFAITQTSLILGHQLWSQTFNAAIVEKHAALNQPDPLHEGRIIFTGGSATAFGIRSESVGKSLGRVPSNLGLTAGLGARFILNETKDAAKCGDVIVLSLEYDIDWSVSGSLASIYMNTKYGEQFGGLTSADKIRLRAIYFRTTVESEFTTNLSSGFYSRHAFNAFGDMGSEVPATVAALRTQAANGADLSAQGFLEQIRRVSKTVESNGGVFFLNAPPIAQSFSGPRTKELARYWAAAAKVLGANHLLLTPNDSTFADADFYDTKYHLNGEARARYTSMLAKRLEEHLRSVGLHPTCS